MKTLIEYLVGKVQAGASTVAELRKLADHAGYHTGSVRQTLATLAGNGRLIRIKLGRYAMPATDQRRITDYEHIRTAQTAAGRAYRLGDIAAFLGMSGSQKLKVLLPDSVLYRAGDGDYCTRKGLNQILLQSRSPKAKEFREWLGDEVLESVHETGIVANPQDPDVIAAIQLLRIRDEQATQRAKLAAFDQRLITVENQAAIDPPDLKSTVEAIVDNYQPATESQLDTLDSTIRSCAHGFQDQAKAENRDPLPPQREFINAIKRDIKKHIGIGRWEDMTYAQAIKSQRMADNIKGRAYSHRTRKYDTGYDQVN